MPAPPRWGYFWHCGPQSRSSAASPDATHRRFGRKDMLIVTIAAAVLCLLLLPLVGVWGTNPVMVGPGPGLGIAQPLTMAWVMLLAAASSHGAVLGQRITVNPLPRSHCPWPSAPPSPSPWPSLKFSGRTQRYRARPLPWWRDWMPDRQLHPK